MNTMGKLMNAWYSKLNGNITYGGSSVDVYKESAPEGETSHYVILRAEGETNSSNKRSFADESVVIVDIVTVFENTVDRSVVEDIDGQIDALVTSAPGKSNLSEQSGMLIVRMVRESSNYLPENDGTNQYYRKISRYNHRILQTA